MSRRRWIADEFSADRAALTGAHAAHLARTLRARVGQQFEIVCGGQVWLGTVVSVAEDRVEFTLGEQIQVEAAVPITLLLAIFKFDRMEWAIEKCTELNVTNIVPVIAHRTEKHLAAAAEKRVERWRRIACEASEQSRRITPPEISAPVKLKDALSTLADHKPARPQLSAKKNELSSQPRSAATSGGPALSESREPKGICGSSIRELNIVLAETERGISLTDILSAYQNVEWLALAIGPEGGWTAEELQLFAGAHWIAASLGETILRAETAAIAALAIARAAIGSSEPRDK
ncbi:MAG TPA: RsmE family RNA methyltransferase [Terracidiphilus sp.]|nr:RsmE family RNA methyltransferase [Terracidiphilus sp.]